MRARVLFFGMLKDIVGMSREEAEFPEGADLRAVFAAYAARFPRLGDLSRSIVVARNQEFADPATRLAEGDEVAFLPPVSGGRNTDDLEIREAGHYFALTRHAIDIRASDRAPAHRRRGRGGDLRGHRPQPHQGTVHTLPGLRMLRIHGAQDDGADRPRDRRRALRWSASPWCIAWDAC